MESAKKLFFWYSLARTFLQHPYPMWADSDDMWQPAISEEREQAVFQHAFSIGYAENECIETSFPGNNPIPGISELVINNPMTPLSHDSFWNSTLLPYCSTQLPPASKTLIDSVDKLFSDWKHLFQNRSELPLSKRAYMLDDRGLTLGAGILQIKDYANEANDELLQTDISEIHRRLKEAKSFFFESVTETGGLDYFGSSKEVLSLPAKKDVVSAKPPSKRATTATA